MTNNYGLSYEELLDLTNEISPHQWFLNSLIHLALWMIYLHLEFQNTGTVLDTITFLWLIDPKLIDTVEIKFRIELL